MINIVNALIPLEDASENNNSLTVTGAIYNNTAGHDGLGAYKLDGIGDYLANRSSTYNASVTNKLTIAFWSYNLPKSSWQVAVGTMYNDYKYWSVMRESYYFRLNIFVSASDFWGGRKQCGFMYNDSGWLYVVMTYNNATGLMKAYKNGNLTTTCNIGTAVDPIRVLGTDIYIGSPNFNGTLDEIRIYDRELNASEVSDLYIGNSVSNNGLQAYYPFDNYTAPVDSCTCTAGANWNIVDHCNMINTTCNVAIVNITATGWLNISGTSVLNATKIIWVPRDAEEAFRMRWLTPVKIRWG